MWYCPIPLVWDRHGLIFFWFNSGLAFMSSLKSTSALITSPVWVFFTPRTGLVSPPEQPHCYRIIRRPKESVKFCNLFVATLLRHISSFAQSVGLYADGEGDMWAMPFKQRLARWRKRAKNALVALSASPAGRWRQLMCKCESLQSGFIMVESNTLQA